jgi:hypothetical protein
VPDIVTQPQPTVRHLRDPSRAHGDCPHPLAAHLAPGPRRKPGQLSLDSPVLGQQSPKLLSRRRLQQPRRVGRRCCRQ